MADDLPRLERERADADRAYNDALTALDRSLVRMPPLAGVAAPDPIVPELPPGMLGRWLRPVWQWLAPSLRRQDAANAQFAAALNSAIQRDAERDAAFDRFQDALVRFLQQITAFVETKERLVSASAATRLDAVRDLEAQVAVLQRATQMLTRRTETAAPVGAGPSSSATSAPPQPDEYKYLAFEDQFRGSIEEIRTKLDTYVPIFVGETDVLDVGCGRGEFLIALREAGIVARGIDVNAEMIAAARDRGLDATVADAVSYLAAAPDESLGGLFASQVVEHLEPSYLMRLLDLAFHKLRPRAPIVLETINPTCWLAFFSSYLRDFTHVRPVHPDTLEYLARASGFANVSVRYSAPVPEQMRLRSVDLPPEMTGATDATVRALADVAHAVSANAAILNRLAFSYQDYAVIGYRS